MIKRVFLSLSALLFTVTGQSQEVFAEQNNKFQYGENQILPAEQRLSMIDKLEKWLIVHSNLIGFPEIEKAIQLELLFPLEANEEITMTDLFLNELRKKGRFNVEKIDSDTICRDQTDSKEK